MWFFPREVREVGSTPDYRFSLANERTSLAWIRTSPGLLAGGVAAVQLVPAFKFHRGLQAERTRLAWSRTALSFAAVGALLLHAGTATSHSSNR